MIKEANLCTAFFPMRAGGSNLQRTIGLKAPQRPAPRVQRPGRKDRLRRVVARTCPYVGGNLAAYCAQHFVRTLITSGAEEFPELRKRWGAAFLGSGLLLHHERQHHGRCHTSVSSGVRTYRRQAVDIQLLSSKSGRRAAARSQVTAANAAYARRERQGSA